MNILNVAEVSTEVMTSAHYWPKTAIWSSWRNPLKEVKSVCVVWYRFNSHGVLRFFICFFFLTCPGISCSWQTKSTLLFWWFACRFVRNLLYFYKPSSQRFCTVHISDPQAKTFSEVGCLLVDFLIESEDVRVIVRLCSSYTRWRFSLRKHPFLLALRRCGRFARNVHSETSTAAKSEEKRMFSQANNVCAATEIIPDRTSVHTQELSWRCDAAFRRSWKWSVIYRIGFVPYSGAVWTPIRPVEEVKK